ncbi:ATP-binding protein [Nonomuraea sp. H19]|uniref:ATP-binding protein n=1 Tax=Nonomuraea sp. H19 TaxID=3452206 RepID=UPI003F8C2D6C
MTLFRAVQEALANVARHATAGKTGVTLSYMEDVVVADVRDDGVGFTPSDACGGGFGLTAMRQRVVRLAGNIEVESAPGQGTAISVTVPAIPIAAEQGAT